MSVFGTKLLASSFFCEMRISVWEIFGHGFENPNCKRSFRYVTFCVTAFVYNNFRIERTREFGCVATIWELGKMLI